nr:hypothetical protein [uncultured Flavobacterium sp.]
MNAICTIITGDYGHYALVLHDSICKFNSAIPLYVFISEGDIDSSVLNEINNRENLYLLTKVDLEDSELTQKIYSKYSNNNMDALRWSMKPVVMNHLLQNEYERVIYVDWDIHFFNDFNFLFEELKKCNLLLSPHWRCSDPNLDLETFKLNFLDGIYNGGFVGASRGGIPALEYWAKLCLFNCEVNRNAGFYVDQRYLDLLPTRFDEIKSITHKGCNVANWNIIDCKRVRQVSGEVLINNVYPIVFIHFTNSLFKGVYLSKKDTELIPYIEKYRDTILRYSRVDVIEDFFEKGIHINPRMENTASVMHNKNKPKRIIKQVYKKLKRIILNK